MNDKYFMEEAIKEAKKASKVGDVPVGCVIVVDNKIVSRAHNLRHSKRNVLFHAEMIAIDRVCKKLKRWILDDATIYITIEPCLMCSGAIMQSRIKRLVYGKAEPKFGCVESAAEVFKNEKLNHLIDITKGTCGDEIEEMMKDFFLELRKNKKIDNEKSGY